MSRYLRTFSGEPSTLQTKELNWTTVLEKHGCKLLPFSNFQKDTSEYIYIRDVAIGNIQVPKDVATQMLVLGDLP